MGDVAVEQREAVPEPASETAAGRAPAMQSYLTKQWGAPDVEIGEDRGRRERVAEAAGPNGVAVFAGAHHVGVISQRLKTDDYIYYDSDVVPAVAWILP